jgi:four helix bundle protein
LDFSAASVGNSEEMDAVLSIALNLAEGSAKDSKKDRRRFYQIAFGSIRETQALIAILGLDQISAKVDRIAAHCYRLCLSLRE